MTERNETHDKKKLSLAPLDFEQALGGLLAAGPPPDEPPKEAPPKARRRRTKGQAHAEQPPTWAAALAIRRPALGASSS